MLLYWIICLYGIMLLKFMIWTLVQHWNSLTLSLNLHPFRKLNLHIKQIPGNVSIKFVHFKFSKALYCKWAFHAWKPLTGSYRNYIYWYSLSVYVKMFSFLFRMLSKTMYRVPCYKQEAKPEHERLAKLGNPCLPGNEY